MTCKPKRFIAIFCIISAGLINTAIAEDITYIEQNFDNSKLFKTGKISSQGNPDAKSGGWTGQNNSAFEIVNHPVKSKPHALKITRGNSYKVLSLFRNKVFPAKRNFKVSFWCYAESLNRIGLFVSRRNKSISNPIGGLRLNSMERLFVYNPTLKRRDKWVATGQTVPLKTWFYCELRFDVMQKLYWLKMTTEDGKSIESPPYPLVHGLSISALHFLNTPPKGSSLIVDDIKVSYGSKEASDVSNRKNYALTASVNNKKLNVIKDENHKTGVKLRAGVNTIKMQLKTNSPVNMVRIYSGRSNGSGKLAACNIIGYNASGQSPELVSFTTSQNGNQNKKYLEYKFNMEVLGSLTFKFKGANVFLREIEILSPPIVAESVLKKKFLKKVFGEFRLPVYRKQKKAYLHLFNKEKKSYKVSLTLTERFSGKVIEPMRTINLKPGENKIGFSIDNIPDGSYIALVKDVSGKTGARFRRLLRIQHAVKFKKKKLYEMTGKKMLFPDAHYLSNYNNLTFEACSGKLIEAVKPTLDSNDFTQLGNRLYFDENGKLNVLGRYLNRGWKQEKKIRWFLATSTDDKLDKWTIKKIAKRPIIPPQKLAWEKHTRVPGYKKINGKPIKLRFYNPAKDGKVKLNQVRVWFISRAGKGSILSAKAGNLDWSDINPRKGSGWPIWFKAPGVGLVLTREPVYQDMPLAISELEDPKASNDNWAGQFLSDDGKTLYFTRGMVLRRFPPFNAPWDNLAGASRILTIFYTRDGVNYKSSRMALPDLTDPIASQHYGGIIRRIKNTSGLRLMYTMRYKAYTQQIDVVMSYTWDDIHWKKFPGNEVLASNGPHNSFSAGHVWQPSYMIERDGKTYAVISRVSSVYHFQSEMVNSMTTIKKITPAWVKNHYQPRQLDKSPIFKYFGSWKKLAENTLNSGVGVAVLVCRKDGHFCAKAGDKVGNFTTLPLIAKGSLAINAKIQKGGYIKIELADIKGKKLKRYSGSNAVILKQGDYMDKLLNFGKQKKSFLPRSKFKILVTMINAKLFTFSFQKN